MPGPVNLHPEVKKIYYETFLSHRSSRFYEDVAAFEADLCKFVKAQNAAFFIGSGSLGNEVVAQYLKQLSGKGLILVNGEFGKRLTEQAKHIDLSFDTFEIQLGEAFDYSKINALLASETYTWLWFVNCETSSGVLNDLTKLKVMCNRLGIKVAVDCISTIGNTDVNLDGVLIASSTSGKGLASYPGISIVFFEDTLLSLKTNSIPKYMNLKNHMDTNRVPYTVSTNLFYSLVHAFKGVSHPEHQKNIKIISDYIYGELANLGFSFLGNYEDMMPGIISIICPSEINSYDLGFELERNNFFVNYGGSYLRKANYFQICIMGHQELANAKKLVEFIRIKKLSQALQTAS